MMQHSEPVLDLVDCGACHKPITTAQAYNVYIVRDEVQNGETLTYIMQHDRPCDWGERRETSVIAGAVEAAILHRMRHA